MPNFDLSYQVRQILTPFCNFIALLLDQDNVKVLRVTTIVKKIKFEGTCAMLESRKCVQRQSFTKYLVLSLIFI